MIRRSRAPPPRGHLLQVDRWRTWRWRRRRRGQSRRCSSVSWPDECPPTALANSVLADMTPAIWLLYDQKVAFPSLKHPILPVGVEALGLPHSPLHGGHGELPAGRGEGALRRHQPRSGVHPLRGYTQGCPTSGIMWAVAFDLAVCMLQSALWSVPAILGVYADDTATACHVCEDGLQRDEDDAARLRERSCPRECWKQHKVLLHEAPRITQDAIIREESVEGVRVVVVLGMIALSILQADVVLATRLRRSSPEARK